MMDAFNPADHDLGVQIFYSLVSAVMKLAGISNFSSAPSVGSVPVTISAVTALFAVFAYLTSKKIRHTDLTVLTSK